MLRTRTGVPAGIDDYRIAGADLSREHGSRHDGAVTGERKDAIHGKAKQTARRCVPACATPRRAGNARAMPFPDHPARRR